MALPHLTANRTTGPSRFTRMRMTRNRLGKPLPPALREKLEQIFAADFSQVRIHENHQVGAMGLQALTRGNNIFLAPGLWDPTSRKGLELLGHELAHVLQQDQGRVGRNRGHGLPLVQDPALEMEARRLAEKAVTSVLGATSEVAVLPETRPESAGNKPLNPAEVRESLTVAETAPQVQEPVEPPAQPVPAAVQREPVAEVPVDGV